MENVWNISLAGAIERTTGAEPAWFADDNDFGKQRGQNFKLARFCEQLDYVRSLAAARLRNSGRNFLGLASREGNRQ